jgi:hypothetical protein
MLSPAKEVRWPLNSINAEKPGDREKKRSCRNNFPQSLAENKTQGLP